MIVEAGDISAICGFKNEILADINFDHSNCNWVSNYNSISTSIPGWGFSLPRPDGKLLFFEVAPSPIRS